MAHSTFTPADGEKHLRQSAHIDARKAISDLANSPTAVRYRDHYDSGNSIWQRYTLAWACFRSISLHSHGVKREDVESDARKLLSAKPTPKHFDVALLDLTEHKMAKLDGEYFTASPDGMNSMRFRALCLTVSNAPTATWWD